MYNIYGDVQLKNAEELTLKEYKVGDKVDLPDGIYVGFEGIVVVVKGIFVEQFAFLIDKWGTEFNTYDLVESHHPLLKVIEKAEEEIDGRKVAGDIVLFESNVYKIIRKKVPNDKIGIATALAPFDLLDVAIEGLGVNLPSFGKKEQAGLMKPLVERWNLLLEKFKIKNGTN